MGALIGGLESCGATEAFAEWACSLNQMDVLKLMDPVFGGGGAIRLERVLAKVKELTGEQLIEQLPIPFTAVAADVANHREIWFQNGPLDTAIRASVAIPTIITPVIVNGRLLADGGLINPLPMEPVLGTPADFTMAVTLHGPILPTGRTAPIRSSIKPKSTERWVGRLGRGVADLVNIDVVRSLVSRFTSGTGETLIMPEAPPEVQASEPDSTMPPMVPEAGTPDVSFLEMLDMTIETMTAFVTRLRYPVHPADVLIEVPAESVGILEFHRAEEQIGLGQRLAAAALDQLEDGWRR